MNVLFINSNLYGHINPTIGLCKALVKKGHRVSYFCSETFADQITNEGAEWINFSSRMDQFLKEYRPTDRHPFFMLMEYILLYDEQVLPDILDILKKESYDMIICDSVFGAGSFLKQMTDVPVVCSHSSFAMSKAPVPQRMLVYGFHPQLDHCYEILKRICERYSISEPTIEEVFISKGELNVVYTTPGFNGDEGVREPEYIFSGPSIERPEETEVFDASVIGDRKLVYISLGSLNNDFAGFYNMCLSAFRESDYYVCMSIGKRCDVSILDEIPSNFLVKGFLPQIEILKHADVFITHAGFNSVNEALYYGVPMLALPQINDQHMVAKHVSAMKLGITENIKEITPEILRAKTDELLADREVKESCTRISKEMQNTANLAQTVSKLEEYISERKKRYAVKE